jgi:uncharacterized protein (TIGR03067 family)
MNTVRLTTIVAGLILSGVVTADDKKPADQEAKMLDGIWHVVEGEMSGAKLPAEAAKGIKLTLSGDRYVVVTPQDTDKGTIRLIPNSNPRGMDIVGKEGPNKGKTFPAIYELKGDTLTICYDLSGKARPTEFKTKRDTLLFLARYQRQKS